MKKVVLITGASKGIGKSIAEKFKKENFYVAGVSRSEPEDFSLDLFIEADLTSDKAENIVNHVVEKTGRLDVLINNAGVGLYESWENMKEEDLRYIFEINFLSVVSLTKASIPFLKKTKGDIINVSSVAGKVHVPFMGGYCSSKFALNAFSYSLRAELKPYEINVLNLIIGRINTGFSSRSLGSLKPPDTPFSASPEKLAEKTFDAYKKRKRELIFPWWYRFFIFVGNKFPDIYDRLSIEKWK